MTTTSIDRNTQAEKEKKSSRFPGFYALTLEARQEAMAKFSDLTDEQKKALTSFNALNERTASRLLKIPLVLWVFL